MKNSWTLYATSVGKIRKREVENQKRLDSLEDVKSLKGVGIK
jgi:hypothetical protein